MARRKSKKSLRRGGAKRQPYDRVLIVCEGSKTEPNYLQELVAAHQLSSANIKITGDGGAAPKSVVDLAIRIFNDDPDYDSVFCVFDRDAHATFDDAVQRVNGTSLVRRDGRRKLGPAHFEAITSVPCFEYWILLHHEYTTAALPKYDDVRARLRRIPEFEHYEKGKRGLYWATCGNLSTALANADRANAAATATGATNPSTQMPVLIRYLQELAEKKKR